MNQLICSEAKSRIALSRFPNELRWVRIFMVFWFGLVSLEAGSSRTIEEHSHYLGVAEQPEWFELVDRTPHARELTLDFSGHSNSREHTLLIRQDDVKKQWTVRLNGENLGRLFQMEAPLWQALAIPPRTLKSGNNQLEIRAPSEIDDVRIGPIRLIDQPLNETLTQSTLMIEVTDPDSGEPIPARITLTDEEGALAAVMAQPGQKLAVRPGVVYTADGKARLGLPAGRYKVHATRGFEYSLDTRTVSLEAGDKGRIQLRIRREVATPGLIGCDPHTHTFTYSGHGDATVNERVITLAGEGIELPVATDHNTLTDYSEAARKMGVEAYFTPVIGDEVTTDQAHFNAFPFDPESSPPEHQIEDWTKLLAGIRSTPGVEVVMFNHPHNIHHGFRPFGSEHFNRATGASRGTLSFEVDALEVLNSSAQQADWMQIYRDWFAVLNHGHRITAMGSSDSHDVSRYIVGQGRSYVACNDEDAARLDIEQACRSIRQGRVLVSMGLLTEMTVQGANSEFQVGDLATGLSGTIPVEVTVRAPGWIQAEQVTLFANGIPIRQHQITRSKSAHATADNGGIQARIQWALPVPRHDVHLVAVATGPGVTEPYWKIPRPYQGTAPEWIPHVIGSTNPIWVDADHDNQFTHARGYAEQLWNRVGPDSEGLFSALAEYDQAVAAQAAGLYHQAGMNLQSPRIQKQLRQAPAPVKQGFAAFLNTL